MRDRDRGRRKAAVLLASLDARAAESLLAQMPRDQANSIRETIASLGEIDPAEQSEVLEEFFRIGPLVPDKQPSGLELDDPVAVGHSLATAAPANEPRPAPPRDQPPGALRLLEDAPIQTLATLLEREQPQTVAVVLSHLAPSRAAELLSGLPSAVQAEVARRLVDLDETSLEILQEVERGLEALLSDQSLHGQRRSAGMAALREILSATDPDTKENILANVAAHDRQLAAKLTPAVTSARFTFADVSQLDDASLLKVLRATDRPIVVLALTSASDDFVRRVFSLLAGREEKAIRYALAHLGPIRLSDVEEAQHELAAIAQSLETSAQIRRSRSRLSVAA